METVFDPLIEKAAYPTLEDIKGAITLTTPLELIDSYLQVYLDKLVPYLDKYVTPYTTIVQNTFVECVESLPIDTIWVTYATILISAISIIYFASLATLQKPKNALKPDPSSPLFHPSDLEEVITDDRMISENEAYMMPIMGGIALTSMYYAMKYYTVDNIQFIFKSYFLFTGTFSAAATFSIFLKGLLRIIFNASLPHWRWCLAKDNTNQPFGLVSNIDVELEKKVRASLIERKKKKAAKLAIDSNKEVSDTEFAEENQPTPEEISAKLAPVIETPDQYMNFNFSLGEVLGFPFAIVLSYLYWKTDHWVFGNILGTSVAVTGIRMLKLDTFRTAFIMLAGLFFYDIFFVFGTDVMITVATKIDAPIKLSVPRINVTDPAKSMAMLGLGDIVVPAFFLSLCLRFDSFMFYKNNQDLPYSLARKFPKPYFNFGMLAYIFGLGLTIFIMHTFKAAQPALLYLCPAIASSTLITGYFRNEIKDIWSFSDSEVNDKNDKKLNKSSKKAKGKAQKKKST
ncbi:hypothetical protein NADFUDRAFT_83559 [Nadsonia fulvescens var. elongata DSM 6958]|uniref:Peptidase A22B, signal peptide peptidase n=1 Tax=Nadsonia fulvescens var. elongata DSM 6958 TaxID=857566 RepID=A0A1E3PHD8_9ASCO|nr:hypothetical protein NADFUDRAFT_83559 [Nadsonia fulvescens var. elongata DSM 6958]